MGETRRGRKLQEKQAKKETGLSLGYREMKIDTWLGEGIGVRFHKNIQVYTCTQLFIYLEI